MFTFDFPYQIQHLLTSFWLAVQIALLIYLGLVFYFSLKNPAYAVFLTVIVLPSYLFRTKFNFIPLTFLEICLLILFFSLLINLGVKKERQKKYFYPYRWPILLILLTSTMSVFIAADTDKAAGIWKAYFIEPVMFYIVLINFIQSKKDFRLLAWALGISGFLIAAISIFQKFTGFGIAEVSWYAPNLRKVNAVYTSPNAVALFLGPISAVYMGWLLADVKNKNFSGRFLLKIILLLSFLTTIYFTKSAGGAIAIFTSAIFILFFGLTKKWTILAVLFLILASLIFSPLRHNIGQTFDLADPSWQNRLILWQETWKYLTFSVKNFIFGAGLFSFPQIQNQFRDPLKMEPLLYPHNIFLNFWIETGLAGLAAFLWLMFSFFRNGFKAAAYGNKAFVYGIMSAMVYIIIHGLFDVPYFKNDLSVLFWIIVSLSTMTYTFDK
ncbi:hypothetical protein C4569_03985 [Candidatus Parcubacteria bacterium]|nr:MAG: hypothetical protein C4569_03985 [Candidatus Parcubacteria bacterium]